MAPYISFVTRSRNDNYAPSMLQRLQKSLDLLTAQLERHRLDAEILVVDWNPPADAPRLKEVLKFPAEHARVSVRIIEVDSRFHRRYRYASQRPIQATAAINVGIRRARGTFVLPRAADVFYSEPVVEFFARGELEVDKIYRCDRCDVSAQLVDHPIDNLDMFLKACSENVEVRHERLEVPDELGIKDLHTNASGDFLLMSREQWYHVRGIVESRDTADLDDDSLTLHLAHACGVSEVHLPSNCCVYKLSHSARAVDRVTTAWPAFGIWWEKLLAHGCADTKILNRSRIILNYPKRRVQGFTNILFDSYERNFLREAQRLAAGKAPRRINGEDWGLGRENLPEELVTRASWES